MKILVTGATGNTGIRLLRMSSAEGHTVSAFVRDREKLASQLERDAIAGINIIVGDVFDKESLAEACRGQDVVINAAGNVAEGAQFVRLVESVCWAAEAGLSPGGRFWFFGGAAALDVPGASLMTVDLPKIPGMVRVHQQNYEAVKASSLNWSMLCPGPMIDAPDGEARRGLRISTEEWPVALPRVTRFLPEIAKSLAFRQIMPELTISYEDAARVILDNLGQDSPLGRHRVGVALPPGIRQHKDVSQFDR